MSWTKVKEGIYRINKKTRNKNKRIMIDFNIDNLEYKESTSTSMDRAIYFNETGGLVNITPSEFSYISHDDYIKDLTKSLYNYKNSTIKTLSGSSWRIIGALQIAKRLSKFASINLMHLNVTFTRTGIFELSTTSMSIRIFLRTKTNSFEVKQATFNHSLVEPYDIEDRITNSTIFYNEVEILVREVNIKMGELQSLLIETRDEK